MTNQPKCRACRSVLTQTVVDLGSTPLANSYLSRDQLDLVEPGFPLHARVCSNCRLVQIDDASTPDEIFGHYAYFSSYSSSWMEHARQFCVMAKERFNIDANSMVVEVASNDGYLLKNFVEINVPVLGIEPAANIAKVAEEANVPTDVCFFGEDTARRLVEEGNSADLVIGNNVFAHVPDINDFVAGLARVLKPDGVLSLEFPHLLQLINFVQFDTIYHEHYSYLSLLAIERVFDRHGLRVFDVAELPTHGGSLRLFGCRRDSERHLKTENVDKIRLNEARAKFDHDEGYEGFAPKCKKIQDDLVAFLRQAKADGKSVAAYGAAAKGNTLLNTASIDLNLIEYVVDLNPNKQDLFLPGSRLPIHAPQKISETKPDYVLILPWNLKAEIAAQMQEIESWGGQFVVAVPEITVFSPATPLASENSW